MIASTERQRAAMWRLHLDLVAAEVVAALATSGVRSILIKGPSVANWLYAGQRRDYVDVDLLVAPADFERAGRVLTTIGFTHPHRGFEGIGYRGHAHKWTRGSDSIDLHWTFPTIPADPETVWAVLGAETDRMRVGGAELEVPGLAARTLLVALHAAHHGVDLQPLNDLHLAIETLPPELWDEAAAVAYRLNAAEALGTGLRLLPAGAALADRLGLPTGAPLDVVLQSYGNPPMTRQLSFLLDAKGARSKARIVARQLVPTPTFLRAREPIARKGTVGLAAAYLLRPLRGLWRTPSAIATIIRAKRQGGSSRSP